MSKQKQKGAAFERQVAEYLAEYRFLEMNK